MSNESKLGSSLDNDRPQAEADRAWDKTPFESIRLNFMDGRPGLKLPYPEDGEIYGDYYARIEELAKWYDKEKEE